MSVNKRDAYNSIVWAMVLYLFLYIDPLYLNSSSSWDINSQSHTVLTNSDDPQAGWHTLVHYCMYHSDTFHWRVGSMFQSIPAGSDTHTYHSGPHTGRYSSRDCWHIHRYFPANGAIISQQSLSLFVFQKTCEKFYAELLLKPVMMY